VRHRATESFWRLYEALPEQVRTQADKAFEDLKRDPKHPSLHFKNVGRFWSVRIGRQHRALGVRVDETFVWFWIDDHGDYDRLLRRG
jgi:hypothetical protein